MDIIRAEIEKKRKLLEDQNLLTSNKKFFKRSDLIARQEEEYHTKYGKTTNEESKSSTSSVEGSSAADRGSEHSVLPRSEVISRLRDRAEPILLFGESEHDAFKRLRRVEILEPELNKGFRNDFQEAMESVDQAYLDEIITCGSQTKEERKSNSKPQEPVTSYEEIRQMAKKIGRENKEYDMTLIMKFIQLLLKMWNDQLQIESNEIKTGTKGKMARATYAQTQVYLKPLLRKLKSFTLPEDILESLTEITQHLLNRNYLKASDAYLQMAIGNAPWPIGVTMVGIHARTGREKIFSKNVAHVMNDETQRKYIQAIKRLMTKCQEYFPTDPSRCVEFQPIIKSPILLN